MFNIGPVGSYHLGGSRQTLDVDAARRSGGGSLSSGGEDRWLDSGASAYPLAPQNLNFDKTARWAAEQKASVRANFEAHARQVLADVDITRDPASAPYNNGDGGIRRSQGDASTGSSTLPFESQQDGPRSADSASPGEAREAEQHRWRHEAPLFTPPVKEASEGLDQHRSSPHSNKSSQSHSSPKGSVPVPSASPPQPANASPRSLAKDLAKSIIAPMIDEAVIKTRAGMIGKEGVVFHEHPEPLEKGEFVACVAELLQVSYRSQTRRTCS